jgi:hypothetical protein
MNNISRAILSDILWFMMVFNTIYHHRLYVSYVFQTACQQKKKNEKMKQQ